VAVDNASEHGLLDIEFHSSFPSIPFVYLYYAESSTAGNSFIRVRYSESRLATVFQSLRHTSKARPANDPCGLHASPYAVNTGDIFFLDGSIRVK
jgi:hypothetical protein